MRAKYDHEESTTDAEDGAGNSYQKIVHELEQLKDQVASKHDLMRKVANAYSRSRIRSLNILDLPDELLRIIFEQYMNGIISTGDYFFISDYGYQNGLKDIKNIRLTCRRFCNTSSHLLLRHIDVSMHPSSLAHLDEIACHPLLSKGIQAVRVHFNYFSAYIAMDIIHFTTLAISDLEHDLRSNKLYLERYSDEQHFGIPREKLGLAIDKGELILEQWSRFLNVVRDSEEDPDIIKEEIARSKEVAGLASAHEIYRQHYLAQESVLEDGAFVQAIVTAMSKIPTAKRLFVGDSFRDSFLRHHKYWKPLVDAMEDPESLAARTTVVALDWDTAWSKELDDQPKEILLQLLMAIFDTDIPINHLSLDLSSAVDLSIPLTQEQLQRLAAKTRRLRVFNFQGSASRTGEGLPVGYDPEQIASLCSLVSSCMGGEALTQLNFIMSFALDESAPVSMGSLLAPRHYPNLEILRLTDFPLHLKELKRFLECLNGPICFFMYELWLLSGTWAEALDLIREKAQWESYVVRQHGAECDDMSEEDYEAIFGKERLPSLSDAGTATRDPLSIDLEMKGYITNGRLLFTTCPGPKPCKAAPFAPCSSRLRRIIRGSTEVNAGGPGGGPPGGPPGGPEPAGGGGGEGEGGGGGGGGAEAATDCTGPVVGGPPGTVVGGPEGGDGGAGGVEVVAGPPIFLLVVEVDVEVVLVLGEAGPKARLLLGSPLGTTILEAGTLADELGDTGTDADETTSEGRPKGRLGEAAGVGATGADEDGRGGVTGGGGGTGGADGDVWGGVVGGGGGGVGDADEDATLDDGATDVDDTVTVTVFGEGEDGGGQKVAVTVTVDKQTGNEDEDSRGDVTADDSDDDGRGTDGAGGILEAVLGGGTLEDVLGGVGETLGIDGLDEEAGAAGLVEVPEAPTGPT
ncbi:Hypothetical protein PENO1_094040 [Penicillium occitanis (nom. inval.)]|nr:Hypothetical protein PENO1_094040 [Penicillium occitanis (nom. inval.)]PCG91785.1 hypothetical protein PENOC_095700 [Penicillium occitanis (nom. inval.)]